MPPSAAMVAIEHSTLLGLPCVFVRASTDCLSSYLSCVSAVCAVRARLRFAFEALAGSE